MENQNPEPGKEDYYPVYPEYPCEKAWIFLRPLRPCG
jgi:hypothetical protein